MKATGAAGLAAQRGPVLRASGQLPLWPPNVGGWPGGAAWLNASTVVLRYDIAAALAATTPADNPALRAATDGDLEVLADALGHPEGFGPATTAALEDVALRAAGLDVLALALASPELGLA
jgi:uncharacterized protein (DUF1800 family)